MGVLNVLISQRHMPAALAVSVLCQNYRCSAGIEGPSYASHASQVSAVSCQRVFDIRNLCNSLLFAQKAKKAKP